MRSEALTIVLAMIEISAVAIALHLPAALSLRTLTKISVVNLALIILIGSKLHTTFGWVGSVGDVMYATVFLCQMLILEHFGRRAGTETMWCVALSLGLILLLGQVVKHIPVVLGDTSGDTINLLLAGSARTVWASLAAFMVGQTLVIVLHNAFRSRGLLMRYAFASIVALSFGNAVFYSMAFFDMLTPAEMGTAILVASLTQSVFILLTIPLVHVVSRKGGYFHKRRHHDHQK